MAPESVYEFRPVTMQDRALLRDWQMQPHVRAKWGPGAPYDAAALRDRRVACWIYR